MPVLKNPRHELYAQRLAKGEAEVPAYAAVGYKSDDGNASKLARKVRDRVQEITGKAAERTGITIERVLTELGKLGFANMHDYIRIEDGKPRVDLSRLTRDQAAAITEVTVTSRQERAEDGELPAEVTQVRFKLADKRSALVDLGKHLGMFQDKSTINHNVKVETEFDPSSPQHKMQLAREILFMVADAKNEAKLEAMRVAKAKTIGHTSSIP